MVYLLQVFFLFSVPVFALTGAFMLGLYIWTEAKDYSRARRAMARIAANERAVLDRRYKSALPRVA